MTATLERPLDDRSAAEIHAAAAAIAATAAPSASPTPSVAAPVVKVRDRFLDTVRAMALVRVIIWHTLATAAVSWMIASMPAMFFVAGSLLARSLDRRPWRQLLKTRLRRLLLPFWVYGMVVLSFLAVVHHLDGTAATAIAPTKLLAWIFPLVDPHGSAWEAGWASTPLWYLRCYLWLLLLSPLLRRAHRRFGVRVLLVPLAAIFVVDYLIRNPEHAPQAFLTAKYYLGDLATFSFFWMLGFSHADGAFTGLSRRARLEWAAIGGFSALLWVKYLGLTDLVVNNSYPLLLMVGIGWLGVFLAGEDLINRWVRRPRLAALVDWLGRRSITIYLWHPIAIVAAYWVRSMVAPNSPRVAVLVLVFPLVALLAVLFGRVEDLAAGRAAQWWPGRDDKPRWPRLVGLRGSRGLRSGLIGAAIAVVLLESLVPGAAAASTASSGTPAGNSKLALPPAPSAKPDEANFGATTGTDSSTAAASSGTSTSAAAAASAATGGTGATANAASAGTGTAAAATGTGTGTKVSVSDPAVVAKIQSAVDAWRVKHAVAGVQLGVLSSDGATTLMTSGKATDGSAMDKNATFPVTSITKTMTSAITLELVKEGKIGLDDQLPAITAVPGLPYVGKVTVRQLLNHTAGVMPYDDSPAYATAKSGALTPESALALIKDQQLQWTPGSQVGYSNSGYLTLGLLDQQLSGSAYADLLQARVFGPAGMTNSRLDTTPTAGWSGFSAGGVVSNLTDLLKWGNALYRKNAILAPDSLASMLNIDNKFNSGLGAFPVCPCSTVNGVKVYSSIGHNGGQATLQYAPKQDAVITLNLTESMWTKHLTQQDVAELLTSVEAALTP